MSLKELFVTSTINCQVEDRDAYRLLRKSKLTSSLPVGSITYFDESALRLDLIFIHVSCTIVHLLVCQTHI